jgi:hypothetical protein
VPDLTGAGLEVSEYIVHDGRAAAYGGTMTCRYTVSVTWVDLWPTVSLMSWMGTPFLLMIDTAVCLPSWACQWPMPDGS